jgi:hypothetical protein
MRIFVGTTHLKVDFVAAQTPADASFWVVDASAHQVPGGILHVAPTDATGNAAVYDDRMPTPRTTVSPLPPRTLLVYQTGGPIPAPGGLALSLSAVAGLAVTKSLGASWGIAAIAAVGAPLSLLAIGLLTAYVTRTATPAPDAAR